MPTEDQLNNRRIAAEGGTPIEPEIPQSETFLKTLQDTVLNSANIISSEDTNIEKIFADITKRIDTTTEKSTQRIESQFGREIDFAAKGFEDTRTSIRESQRGFATSTSALDRIDEKAEKSLRDLEQRKQELILAGEVESSKEITRLMLNELEFRQKSKQQAFNNILNSSREIRSINSGKFDLAEKAAEAGAGPDEIAAIMNASSEAAALQIASPFIQVGEGEGELRTVPGVGVVRVFDDNTFKVIVGEQKSGSTGGTLTTSFGDTIELSPEDAKKVERNNLQIFAPDFQLQILRQLKSNEISSFMLDFLEAAREFEKRGQNISPGIFFEQWKLENDIDDGGSLF